ncbi:MAG: TrmH family RNA methyltransferase [Ardenticatenaceae bacterium]
MIKSVQNPKVKQARALRRRRVREREGLLFVEGLRLVEDALASGAVLEWLFFSERGLKNAQIEELVARWRHLAWEVAEKVMAEMAETVTPQGVAAILSLPALAWPTEPTLLLIADQLRDPGNLGTLIRTAAAAGVEGLIVAKGSVDPWRDKVLRAGMGAHFRLPIRDGLAWSEILPLLSGLTVRLADAEGTLSYDAANWSVPSALIIGGEARGASDVAIKRADEIVSIPMVRAVESLNAGVAGSVILFEAFRQRRSSVGTTF